MVPKGSPGHVAIVTVLLIGLALAGCRSVSVHKLLDDVTVSRDIELHRVAEDVWVHTTYSDVPGFGRIPANGLIVVDQYEAMLIDLPSTDEQTSQLLEWLAQKWGITATTVIPTRFHDDSIGGLSEAHRQGAVSHALDKAIALAKERNLSAPQYMFAGELELRCRKTPVIVTHLGVGHTIDHVVVWIPRRRVLFAGPLIKPLSAISLGNTRGGDLSAYPVTLQAVRQAYPKAKVVVPGHGDSGGPDLIDHTLTLCQSSSR